MKENLPENHSHKKPQEQVNHLLRAMNDFFQQRPGSGFLESMDELFTSTPFSNGFPVELDENEKEYVVQAKLPGVKKEQIGIDILPQHITITVQHHETTVEDNQKKETIHQKKMFKQLSRTIPFTKAIDSRYVSASYENGLLTIAIPKIRGKRIDIK